MLSAYVLIESELGKVAKSPGRFETSMVCSWLRTSPDPTTLSPECRRPVWMSWGG
jgi:hypothetical protein